MLCGVEGREGCRRSPGQILVSGIDSRLAP